MVHNSQLTKERKKMQRHLTQKNKSNRITEWEEEGVKKKKKKKKNIPLKKNREKGRREWKKKKKE